MMIRDGLTARVARSQKTWLEDVVVFSGLDDEKRVIRLSIRASVISKLCREVTCQEKAE